MRLQDREAWAAARELFTRTGISTQDFWGIEELEAWKVSSSPSLFTETAGL